MRIPTTTIYFTRASRFIFHRVINPETTVKQFVAGLYFTGASI